MQDFNPNQESIDQQVNVILLRKIIELLEVREEPVESLKADEVRAALRNELSAVIKSIKAIPEPDNKDILKELKALQVAIKAIEVKPNINVEAAQVTIPKIELPDINVPEFVIPPFDIPTPQVNYTPPEIHIPAPVVNVAAPILNVPEVNLEAVINELHIGLEKLRTNNKSRPLAVRLTDGGEWIKELKTLNDHHKHQAQFLTDVTYIKNNSGARINPATEEGIQAIIAALQTGLTGAVTVTSGNITSTVTSGNINTTETSPTFIGDDSQVVTTAGTRVALSSSTLPIKYVIITAKLANTGSIWVGGITIAAGRGRPLVALQSERIDINYLSNVYIDADVSGEGVTFTYFSNEAVSLVGYLVDDDGNLILDDAGNPILGT